MLDPNFYFFVSFLANNSLLLREKSDSWSLIRVLFSSKIIVGRWEDKFKCYLPIKLILASLQMAHVYNWIETVFYSAKLINLLAWLRWTDGSGKVLNQVWVFCVIINIIQNVKKGKIFHTNRGKCKNMHFEVAEIAKSCLQRQS